MQLDGGGVLPGQLELGNLSGKRHQAMAACSSMFYPTASPASASDHSAPQLPQVGIRVMLHGLKHVELNGQMALFVPVDAERAGIEFDCSGRKIVIRYESLFLVCCGPPLDGHPHASSSSSAAASSSGLTTTSSNMLPSRCDHGLQVQSLLEQAKQT